MALLPGSCPPVAYLQLGPYLAAGVVEDHYGVLGLTARTFTLADGAERSTKMRHESRLPEWRREGG